MAAENLPVQLACRVLGVSESGFYAWRSRPPSALALRHTWLTELIRQVHVDSRGVYGARRVHAELTLGHGVRVGTEAVTLLMRRAGIQGISGTVSLAANTKRPRCRRSRRSTVRSHRSRSAVGQ
jgi:putative transposase